MADVRDGDDAGRRRREAEARWAEARPFFDEATPEANARAWALLDEARRADPAFAPVLAHLSYVHVRDHLHGWRSEPGFDGDPLARADELAQAALAADPDGYEGHWGVGIVRLYQGDAEGALRSYRRARELCPEDDPALPTLLSEMVEALLAAGREGEAVRQAEEAIERRRAAGGRVPGWFLWNLAYARLAAGDAAGAVEVLERVDEAERSPFLLMDLAYAYQRASGFLEDPRAREAVGRCLERAECRTEVAARQPFAAAIPRGEFLAALRAAGLP
jgi:tetratricopeptide (TPR) repeat protein